MANNTESLAAYHLLQSKIHFANGGIVTSVSASPSNHGVAIQTIYEVLTLSETTRVQGRLSGVKPASLVINKKTNRSLLGVKIEESFYKLLDIQNNPIIANFSNAIESGYGKLIEADFKNMRATITEIHQSFKEAGKDLNKISHFSTFLNDFLHSERGLITILEGLSTENKGAIIGSYFGHVNRTFGLIGELNKVLQFKKAGEVDLATGLKLKGQKTRLIEEKTETGKSVVGDVMLRLKFTQSKTGAVESVEIDVPVSVKTSKRDNTKTFHIYKGNPSLHLDPSILVDFTNIYLSKKTAYRALLAAMIADFGLAGRGATEINQRPLFLFKQTPNFLGVYFFFEIYSYYAKNAGNLSEIPIVEVKDYKYQTVQSNSPIDRINNHIMNAKSKLAIGNVNTGRKFFAGVVKDKMQGDEPYMGYKKAKERVSFTASLKGVWPKFGDTRNSSKQKVHHEINIYRNPKLKP